MRQHEGHSLRCAVTPSSRGSCHLAKPQTLSPSPLPPALDNLNSWTLSSPVDTSCQEAFLLSPQPSEPAARARTVPAEGSRCRGRAVSDGCLGEQREPGSSVASADFQIWSPGSPAFSEAAATQICLRVGLAPGYEEKVNRKKEKTLFSSQL